MLARLLKWVMGPRLPRPMDYLASASYTGSADAELTGIAARLRAYYGKAEPLRRSLIARATAAVPSDSPIRHTAGELVAGILAYEGYFDLPVLPTDRRLSIGESWEFVALAKNRLLLFEEPQKQEVLVQALGSLITMLLPPPVPDYEAGQASLLISIHDLLPELPQTIEGVLGIFCMLEEEEGLCQALNNRLQRNFFAYAGIDIDSERGSTRQPIMPHQATDLIPEELVSAYLGQTPLERFLKTTVPFTIPLSSRFEHMHVLGGSGHGKTQLLQSLLLCDLRKVAAGEASVIVIDSQGDFIRTILSRAAVCDMAERVVYINPTDLEYPPCLNLFDFGLRRLSAYSKLDQERMVNGAISLYEYIFGALLGAELTNRQGVTFRYLARLLMEVPDAGIHTLLDFMEQPERVRQYLGRLDPLSRRFFENMFFTSRFDTTREQIQSRLWGVLSNQILAKMFAHSQNKLDLFRSMNKGNLILINTAKELLKQDGCTIFGRFFIALLSQAVQERAMLARENRLPTFVYIDEAADYFDQSVEQLFNQSRKYAVGLVAANQNFGQMDSSLQQTILASTSIKCAGGVSQRDAATMAKEMGAKPEYVQGMRKRGTYTEFACFIRNVTAHPVRLPIPLGQLESLPTATDDALAALLERNRNSYCARSGEERHERTTEEVFDLDNPGEVI